jgi:hydroxypyruvate isomerase
MPRFAANLSMLFTEVPFLERFGAAARAGFQAVEFQFPYDFKAEEIAQAAEQAGVQMVLHNVPAGDWRAGDRGIAADPGRVSAFREGVPVALAYAKTLGVKRLNVLAGVLAPGVSHEQAYRTLVDNVRWAAPLMAEAGVRLLVEPINNKDIPGFLLNTAADGLRVLDAVAAPNAYLQYDAYHMQRSQGELTETLRGCLKRVGHIQIADVPGRHEPGTGEINYPWWLRELDAMCYRGWVGCEYIPQGRTEDGLAWMGPFAADVPP